ncbi:MAG: hypothetical protein OCC46_15355 [Pseudodesulfovibrio sp.]
MKIINTLISFAFICILALPASAFTPDDVELTALMQKNFGALTSWEAEMSFVDYPDVTAHIWYARGKWRQEWKAGDKASAVGMNGSVVAQCTAENFPLSPLFVWMPINPVETWKSWGVDNATSTYGFCGENPCLMFGAEPGDETSPVVQLNNEDMSPIQVRYGSGAGQTVLQFSEYRTFGGFRVPDAMTLTVGDTKLDAKIKWIAVNRADDEALYAYDALDTTPCAAPPSPFDIFLNSFRYPSVQ